MIGLTGPLRFFTIKYFRRFIGSLSDKLGICYFKRPSSHVNRRLVILGDSRVRLLGALRFLIVLASHGCAIVGGSSSTTIWPVVQKWWDRLRISTLDLVHVEEAECSASTDPAPSCDSDSYLARCL